MSEMPISHSRDVPDDPDQPFRLRVVNFLKNAHRCVFMTNLVMLPLVLALISAVLVYFLLSASHTFISLMLNDTFTMLDGAYRMSLGYVPHVDFHTELGFLTLGFPALALLMTDNIGTTIPTALALYVIALSPFAIYVVSTRLKYWIAIPFYLYVIFMMATPFIIGGSPLYISLAYIYTRLGWVGLLILYTLYITPLVNFKKAWIFDSITAAVITGFLFYTKINFGLVAAAAIVLMAILNREWRKTAAFSLLFLCVIIGLVEVVYGLNYGYVRDIEVLIHIRSAIGRGGMGLIAAALKNIDYIAASAAIIGLLYIFGKMTIRDFLFFGYVITSGFMLFITSAQEGQLPAIIVILLLGSERMVRCYESERVESAKYLAAGLFSIFIIMISKPLGYSVAAFSVNYMKTTEQLQGNVDGRANAASYFLVEDWPIGPKNHQTKRAIEQFGKDNFFEVEKYISSKMVILQQHYFQTILAGEEFLQENSTPSDRVIVFDFANPFSFLMGFQPPTGDQLTYYYNFTFTEQYHPDQDEMFSNVSMVMIPKTSLVPDSRDAMVEIYGGYLRDHYDLIHDDQYWAVWRSKGAHS